MLHRITLTTCSLLLAAAPGWAAGTLQFYEDSLGGPGVTAGFPHGTGLLADIDFDANSAEGGGLTQGASEIEMRPTGSVVFVGFTCQLADCLVNFVGGNQGGGAFIKVGDGDTAEEHGIFELGDIQFDAPSGGGSIELITCNYSDTDGVPPRERTCSPFTLVTMPEPRLGVLFAAGAALLFGPLRRLRCGSSPIRAVEKA